MYLWGKRVPKHLKRVRRLGHKWCTSAHKQPVTSLMAATLRNDLCLLSRYFFSFDPLPPPYQNPPSLSSSIPLKVFTMSSDKVLTLEQLPTIRQLLKKGVLKQPEQGIEELNPNDKLLDKISFQ